MKKKKITLIVFIVCVFVFTSCFRVRGHSGEFPDLFTVAVSSLVTESFINDIETEFECEVFKIEEDDYGRVLFSYRDKDYNFIKNNVLISQYTESGRVYFYQNFNFICSRLSNEDYYSGNYRNNPLIWVSEEDLNNLKKWNDWNKPINNEKCVSALVRNIFDDKEYNEVPIEVENRINGIQSSYVVSRDNYDNKLIFVETNENDYVCIVSKTGRILNENFYVEYANNNTGFYLPFEANYEYQIQLKWLRDNNFWNIKSIDHILDEK